MLRLPSISFSARSDALPTLLKGARERGLSIQCPLAENDLTERPRIKGIGKHGLPLIGVKAPKLREIKERFFENKGVIAFEGLNRLFPRIRDFRRFFVGINKQVQRQPNISATLHLPQQYEANTNTLKLRVVGEVNRNQDTNDHITHPHVDSGPLDHAYLRTPLFWNPYLVSIADRVHAGRKTGSVMRVLANTASYTEVGGLWGGINNIKDNPGGTLRPVLQREVEQHGYILLPHTGCLYIGSNIETPSLKRWGHYHLPTEEYCDAIFNSWHRPAGSTISHDNADDIEDGLSASVHGWRLPYMLAQHFRPHPDYYGRISTPDDLRQFIQTGNLNHYQ